jgi:hypothetical protein
MKESMKKKKLAEVGSRPPATSITRATPPGGVAPSYAEFEVNLAKVEQLMAKRTPRLRIYETMAPMPSRTVDDYMARVRRRWAEAMAAQRPELIAEALERIDDMVASLTDEKAVVSAERLRAELLGLVGTHAAVAVQVNVGAQNNGPDLSLWTAEEIAAYDAKLAEIEAIEAAVARRLAVGG